MYSIKLTNQVTKVSFVVESLEDLATSAYNYVFDLVLPGNIDTGEYEYQLFDENNDLKATGLCQIGDYIPPKKAYTGNTRTTYKQYTN